MKDGFTLIEIIIVVIIIGILSTFGISQYIPVRERALGKEAIANLKLISAAEKIYRMETGEYYPLRTTTDIIADINANLKLSLTGTNWDYKIQAGSNFFIAYASRKGLGGYLDCEYMIENSREEPVPRNANCP